ncbi:serine/threonine-protein kinase 19 homolog isoform X2 [Phoenix dactylifera]|uniref:Serine/threonine-protein kinase 19 homolog isoform X2 n=1 Tax=Phoenix dactylifera TaxID=42345 RepID=A0A8B7D0H6_PHODC|nr:serine/threonine-protein kinase 19 homolog isoform X2 [Phoenix dactylifera]
MAAESSRSFGKKRVRDEESILDKGDADRTLGLENNLTFSDTLIALQMMRAQFPNIEKVAMQPFILRSQLYSSVKDRTQVDRDLEVAIAVKRLEIKNQQDLEVFEWFKKYVIETKLDVSIDHQELCALLSCGAEVKDKHVTFLISAGLLNRQLIDPNMYWFTIPNIGSILKGLSQGRKELLSFLNRRKFKEMLLAPLEKKQLRFSPLDMRFHLRDLIGSGHLKTVRTPTGLLVRVSKD